MPMYMDIHEVQGATAEAVAKAHLADMETQKKYGVEYHKYWFNESTGKIFCLCSAPNSGGGGESPSRSARPARGEDHRSRAGDRRGFMGSAEVNSAGAALVPGGAENHRDPGIRTVMFTDIVGSTELTQRHRDEAAMAFLDVHDRVVREALSALGGREVKHTGDGIMASFLSAVAAARCAAQIHRALAEYEQAKRGIPIKVRIGAAAGEPVENHMDLFGSTVQLAARLCCPCATRAKPRLERGRRAVPREGPRLPGPRRNVIQGLRSPDPGPRDPIARAAVRGNTQ